MDKTNPERLRLRKKLQAQYDRLTSKKRGLQRKNIGSLDDISDFVVEQVRALLNGD